MPPSATRTVHRPTSALLSLTRTLAFSEFKLRYSGSMLGYFWSVSKPLALFGVLYFAFIHVLKFGQGIDHFPLQLLLAVVLWTFFAETTIGATTVLVARADMIRKVPFPHVVLPISVGVTAALAMLFNLLAVVVYIVASGIDVTRFWLVFPFLLVELYLFALGVSLILSVLFVKFRDIGQAWELGLQLLFYSTPIIYPLSLVPDRWRPIIMCNPIAQIIQQARTVIVTPEAGHLSAVLHGPLYAVPYSIVLVTVVSGVLLYRHETPKLAEQL